jgi:hypothetical protein
MSVEDQHGMAMGALRRPEEVNRFFVASRIAAHVPQKINVRIEVESDFECMLSINQQRPDGVFGIEVGNDNEQIPLIHPSTPDA